MAFGVDDAVIAAGISAAGALGAAGTSAAAQSSMNKATREFNRDEAQKQREWNEAMMTLQNEWNESFWNKSNEYNSASAQVERLREAGLNPLYYGIDGVAAAPMESAQPLAYERASLGPLPNPISAGIDSAVKAAQLSNIAADTAKKTNESFSEAARRDKILAETDNARQELLNLHSQKDLTDAQKDQIDKALSWVDRLNEAVIKEKDSSAKLNDAQRNRIDSLLQGEKLLQSRTLEDFEHRWSLIDSQISKMSEETKILKEDLVNYALNHMQGGVFGTGGSVPNLLRFLLGVFRDDPKPSGVR